MTISHRDTDTVTVGRLTGSQLSLVIIIYTERKVTVHCLPWE